MRGIKRHTSPWISTVLLLVLASPATYAQSLRTVALSGRPAPSGDGDALTFDQIGLATINEQGQVALVARALADGVPAAGGIWSEGAGAGLELVAFDGREAPGVANGVFTGLDANFPLINNAGQTLFRGRLNTAPGITGTSNSGAWIASPGQVPMLIVREGEIAPGTTTGVFAEQSDVVGQRFSALNNAGQFAWTTQLQIGTGGVTGNSDFGVWRAGGGPTLMVGRESAVAAGVVPTRYYGSISASPVINDAGQVAILAPLKTTPAGTTSSGSGIWLGDPSTGMNLIARDGDPAPGVPSGTFAGFSTPVINHAGEFAFYGSMAVAGEVTASNNTVLWAQRGGNPLAQIARESQHAPGTGPAVGFAAFDEVRINAEGHIAFRASLTGIPGQGASGVTTLNDIGLWSDVGGAGLELIVRENDPAPDTADGVLFDLIQSPTLNASGQLAFMSDLRGTGITSANNTAIWLKSPGAAMELVLREGDTIDVDDGPGVELRTISQLGMFTDSGGEDGRRSGLNDAGQIVFTVLFADNTSGIFVFSPGTNVPVLPGDYNGDKVVNAADYTVWRDNLGTNFDLNGNGDERDASEGVVDAADYAWWKQHFGHKLPVGGGLAAKSISTVPEPSVIVLLISASILCGSCRRPKAS